jgi:hypothetical protein
MGHCYWGHPRRHCYFQNGWMRAAQNWMTHWGVGECLTWEKVGHRWLKRRYLEGNPYQNG